MSHKIEILEITDNDDGSANVTLEMDHDAVMIFAKIGLLKVLTDTANDVLSSELTESVHDINNKE